MNRDKAIDEIARGHGARAIEVLTEVMDDWSAEDRDRIRAAEAVLDRGYGKPNQAIISVPASRQQQALLAGMSDAQLVAIIEAKQLPRLTPAQEMVTVEAAPTTRLTETPKASVASIHGPADDTYAEPALDPLLE